MDLVLLLKAALMGLVEGLTEFLPISSTGHLILTGSLLGLHGAATKTFEVAIQTGAMFAVMWEYRQRLVATLAGITSQQSARRFAINVLIAFIPAALLGLLFGKFIKERLFHPVPVALAFILGGIVILLVEWRHQKHYGRRDEAGQRQARVETVDDMTMFDALKIGLAQCLALVPGTSRSGATIIGGMLFGLSRKVAAEFSFYLAIPTLIGAGAYSLYKERAGLSINDWPMFAVGLVVSFVSALLCIRWLIRYISTHNFTVFAWYRIVFGGLVLWTAYAGWIDWSHT